jgi:RNA-directed DNA polymerase
MDISVERLWRVWLDFRKGKTWTAEMERFSFGLEENIFGLHEELKTEEYEPGGYRYFMVHDPKPRRIAVAPVWDRLVHRLLYDYLVAVFDHSFDHDVYSCRKGKGLTAAWDRAQELLARQAKGIYWHGDIHHFFESVDHDILKNLVARRVKNERARWLANKVIESYAPGMPIGNLTSQVFANIYLNELDRFIRHQIKPAGYARYGDNVLMVDGKRRRLAKGGELVGSFLKEKLRLRLNERQTILRLTRRGVKWLGMTIYSNGRRLLRRNVSKIRRGLTLNNASSYRGMALAARQKQVTEMVSWQLLEKGLL